MKAIVTRALAAAAIAAALGICAGWTSSGSNFGAVSDDEVCSLYGGVCIAWSYKGCSLPKPKDGEEEVGDPQFDGDDDEPKCKARRCWVPDTVAGTHAFDHVGIGRGCTKDGSKVKGCGVVLTEPLPCSIALE